MSNPVLLLVAAMFPALVAVKQGRIAICPCEKNGSPLGATRWSGPLFGGTCLSGPPHNVGLPIALQRARQACPSEFSLWSDPLVGRVKYYYTDNIS